MRLKNQSELCVYIGYNIKFHASVSRPQAMKRDVGSKSVYGTPSGFGNRPRIS